MFVGGKSTRRIPVYTIDTEDDWLWPKDDEIPKTWRFSHYRSLEVEDFNRIFGMYNGEQVWEPDPNIPITKVICEGANGPDDPFHKPSPPLVTICELIVVEYEDRYRFHRCPICGKWFSR